MKIEIWWSMLKTLLVFNTDLSSAKLATCLTQCTLCINRISAVSVNVNSNFGILLGIFIFDDFMVISNTEKIARLQRCCIGIWTIFLLHLKLFQNILFHVFHLIECCICITYYSIYTYYTKWVLSFISMLFILIVYVFQYAWNHYNA